MRVRGNAHQVYEKYLALARDATASGDRIAAEGYYQFAEHYFRIFSDSTDPDRAQPDGQRTGQQRRPEGGGHYGEGPQPTIAEPEQGDGAAPAAPAATPAANGADGASEPETLSPPPEGPSEVSEEPSEVSEEPSEVSEEPSEAPAKKPRRKTTRRSARSAENGADREAKSENKATAAEDGATEDGTAEDGDSETATP